MKNNGVQQERISALADGELEPNELDAVLASLRQPEGRGQWDAYHRIGDVLRSDEMDVDLSPGFSARMAARLDAEPTILAPAARPALKEPVSSNRETAKRFAVPGMAAVMAVFAAYLAAPHFLNGGEPTGNVASSMIASASSQAITSASVVSEPADAMVASADASISPAQEQVVLRDPSIDEYLSAHQRYSPSLYDTTQFVRSATFETEPKN